MTREEFDAMAWQKGDRVRVLCGDEYEIDSVDFENRTIAWGLCGCYFDDIIEVIKPDGENNDT
jgi:hypothetical protein